MFQLSISVFSALAATLLSQAEVPPKLECHSGPAKRTYGGTEWLAYACNDEKTAVLVSAPGSPAMTFFFILIPQEDSVRIYGEGNADQTLTGLALEELKQFSKQDLEDLVQEAMREDDSDTH